MFKAVLFLMLLCPGMTCLVGHVSAENAQKQPTYLSLVDVLIKYAKLGQNLQPPLNQAMQAEDYQAVRLLAPYVADINTRGHHDQGVNAGQTVLESAIEKNKKSLTRYLLKNGANPYLFRMRRLPPQPNIMYNETTAVFDIIRAGKVDYLELLVDVGIDFNKVCVKYYPDQQFSLKPLQLAIHLENKEVIQFLVDHGAKI